MCLGVKKSEEPGLLHTHSPGYLDGSGGRVVKLGVGAREHCTTPSEKPKPKLSKDLWVRHATSSISIWKAKLVEEAAGLSLMAGCARSHLQWIGHGHCWCCNLLEDGQAKDFGLSLPQIYLASLDATFYICWFPEFHKQHLNNEIRKQELEASK